MSRLQVWLHRVPLWIWPWSLTAGAICAAACAALWLTPSWQQQATRLQEAAARQRDGEAAARRLEMAARVNADSWRDKLPSVAQRDARLTALLDAATQSDVSLLSAEQTGAEPAAGGVSRQRLNLSLRGRYPELRRFVETVLLGDPGLAVERISFNRGRAEDPVLEARVQLSLLQRETGEAAR